MEVREWGSRLTYAEAYAEHRPLVSASRLGIAVVSSRLIVSSDEKSQACQNPKF